MSPDVSIVVVTHDSAADLSRSLPSAVAQKGVSVEIVVVDNASTDPSRDVALLYAPNVRVLALPENVGFAAATNAATGMSACSVAAWVTNAGVVTSSRPAIHRRSSGA